MENEEKNDVWYTYLGDKCDWLQNSSLWDFFLRIEVGNKGFLLKPMKA